MKIKFTERLKELREEKGWTQDKLAKMLGYTESCVGKWERGKTEPNLNDLARVAQFFNVTTDYLLGLTDL